MIEGIEEAVRARQPDYPPNMSMAGKNSYSHSCKVVGYTPGYCVCLHKIAAYERDGTVRGSPDCEKAISLKTCPATNLRQLEREAGKALFFIDRDILREEMDKHFNSIHPSFARTTPAKSAFNQSSSKPESKPAPAPKPTVKSDDRLMDMPESEGFAAAINIAIKEAQTAVPALKEEVPPPSNKPKSLLDVARKQMGNIAKEDKS